MMPIYKEYLEVKPKKESQTVSKDVVSTLIGKLGLSLGRGFDEADGIEVRVQNA